MADPNPRYFDPEPEERPLVPVAKRRKRLRMGQIADQAGARPASVKKLPETGGKLPR